LLSSKSTAEIGWELNCVMGKHRSSRTVLQEIQSHQHIMFMLTVDLK